MTKTLIGYLRAVSDGGYFMECQDGTLEIVYGAKGIPVNKLIALCVNDTSWWVFDEPDRRYSLLAEDPAEQTNHKRVAIFRTVPYGSTDEIKAKWQKKVDDMARDFQRYWQFHNRNWIIECHGYVLEYEGTTGSPWYCNKETGDFYRAGGCGDFHPNYWMIWGGTSSSKCGTGMLGGNRAVIYDGMSCGTRTAIHESGHNYELHHSGNIEADGDVSEYGDPTDIMGSTGEMVGFCSPHFIQMNLDTGREIKIVDHTQQIMIVPIETSYHSMHPQTDQHVLVKQLDASTLHLTLKKDHGYKFAQTRGTGNRLYVHIRERDDKTKMLEPYMSVGDYRVFEKVSVKYLEYNEKMEIAVVNVRYDDKPIIPLVIPTGLPQNIPSVELDESYNGTWFDPRFAGQGLNVTIKNGTVSVFWFTFAKDGSLNYLFGACKISDQIETMTLYKTRGGTFDDPTTYKEDPVGIAQVYFYDHTRGVFVYQCPDYGNGSIEITPAGPLTVDPRNGVRYDPAKIGSGFCIAYYNQMPTDIDGDLVYQDRISMSWYTFDNKGKLLWLSCEGVKSLDDDTYFLDIYEVLNGEFMYFSNVVFNRVGSAIWKPQTNTFGYDISSGKVIGNGAMTLFEEAF